MTVSAPEEEVGPPLKEQIKAYLDKYVVPVGTSAGAVLLAAAGWTPSLEWPWYATGLFLLAGAGLTGWAVLFDLRHHKPKMLRLTQANWALEQAAKNHSQALSDKDASHSREIAALRGELDHRSVDLVRVVNVLLRALSAEGNMTRNDTRISVYRHDDSSFYLVGRVSANVQLERVGRDHYPDTQGYISQVWFGQTTKTKVTLPSNRTEWNATQVAEYGLSEAEAASLRMQSLAMFGCKLQRDEHEVPYGVLCIESTHTSVIPVSTVKSLQTTQPFRLLTDILEISMKDLSGSDARRGLMTGRGLALAQTTTDSRLT